jgi:hypothetical protein
VDGPQVDLAGHGVRVLGLVPELEGVDTDAGRWSPVAHAMPGKVDLRPIHALVGKR